MVHIFFIRNYPWVWWCSLNWNEYLQIGEYVGEWVWVGRGGYE